MIIVTGAAGFIGSHIALKFSPSSVVAVDQLPLFKKNGYIGGAIPGKDSGSDNQPLDVKFADASTFLSEVNEYKSARWVIHMGAITNTAETDATLLDTWNTNYSKTVWNFCSQNQIPLIYASSAATYGDGRLGFEDDHEVVSKLQPLNLYGWSKQKFDLWALEQKSAPPVWYGLKFFNVYGPHENHKGPMASSIWHGYNEINKFGQMTLFRSHNPDYKDGQQARDFIFIQDILNIIDFIVGKKPSSGIYNCGTGSAQTFSDISRELFQQLGKSEKINWIDTPVEYRKAYQYKTQANTGKLRGAGFADPFTSLKEGIRQYTRCQP